MSNRIHPTRQTGPDRQFESQVDIVNDNNWPYSLVPPRGFPTIHRLPECRRHLTPRISSRNTDLRNAQADGECFPESSGAAASNAYGRVDLCFPRDFHRLFGDMEGRVHCCLVECSRCPLTD
jgi:hypothetical protein